MSLDFIASLVAFLLTVMVLSYLLGDNPAFRLAVHVFIGIAAGYVAAVAWWQVLWPNLLLPLAGGFSTNVMVLVIPLVLSGLLLMKVWPPLTRLGTPTMGMLVGATAAVAVGGAIQGTIFPQTVSTVGVFDVQDPVSPEALMNGVLILVGVITSLGYFHFSARPRKDGGIRRAGIVELVAVIGSIFVAITLGVLFAGVYSSALTALIERLNFLGNFAWGG